MHQADYLSIAFKKPVPSPSNLNLTECQKNQPTKQTKNLNSETWEERRESRREKREKDKRREGREKDKRREKRGKRRGKGK